MADNEARRRVPLVRVDGANNGLTTERLATEPRLLRRFKTGRTVQAEAVLDLGDCLYFYAGHACPNFGDLVFVVDPEMSSAWSGYATPFDTGGIVGYIHADGLPGKALDKDKRDDPSKLSQDERTMFQDYTHRHRWPLSQWQNEFDDFIAANYDHPADYVLGARPKGDDPTHRFLHSGNDRQAWTWEIQAHCDHEILDGLWLLCINSDHYNELRKAVRLLPASRLRSRWNTMLSNRDIVPKLSDEHVCEEAEWRIAEWL